MTNFHYSPLNASGKISISNSSGTLSPQRIAFTVLFFLVIFYIFVVWRGIFNDDFKNKSLNMETCHDRLPLIIVITPTRKRVQRLADITRFSQTLMHIQDLHWILVEDDVQISVPVDRILQRSKIRYNYFSTSNDSAKAHGWSDPRRPRNMALEFIKNRYKHLNNCGVVFFADDDNTYDLRLFDEYIRNVKGIGVWAVGLVGGAIVEAPHVENEIVTKWDVEYLPGRSFAVDMAGFAVNIRLILERNATFPATCKGDPEPCFLDQFGLRLNQLESFGHNSEPKDILVWHTRTCWTQCGQGSLAGTNRGYVVE